ncbi:MAG: hypothetical protein PVSMB10_03480 [Pseudarthrobacter sp.]
MNDILPIILSIVAALVVIGGLIPVLMKTRKNINQYPGTRDANDPVRGGGTLLEDAPVAPAARQAPAGVDLEDLEITEVPDDAAGLETIPVETPLPVAGRLTRLRERLVRSNNILGKGLLALLSSDKIDENVWDEVEETLLLADLGTEPTMQLVDALRERVKVLGTRTPEQVKALLREELIKLVDPTMDRSLRTERHGDKPAIMLVVGVNGVGKTTTVGKLARVLVAEDKDVLLGAADTFRAAAAEQLATWGQRVGVPTVKSDVDGADPASVAYEAVKAGIDQEVDVVMIDTAGRLQNKTGLMDELGKVKRVIEKLAEVDEVLLVLDATTGQNGLNQARVFAEVVNITGIVLTKLDGTAKGGIVVAVQRQLGVPVKLVGLGEGPDDLAPSDAEAFCGRAAELGPVPFHGLARDGPAGGCHYQDAAGDAEGPAVPEPVSDDSHQDRAGNCSDISGHLVGGEDFSAGPFVADDVRDGGLLGRTQQAGTRSGHGGGNQEPAQLRSEADGGRGQTGHNESGDHQRLPAKGVGQPSGKCQCSRVAARKHGQCQAGGLRACTQRGNSKERNGGHPHPEGCPAVGEARNQHGPVRTHLEGVGKTHGRAAVARRPG